jgi:hypothetical protein
MSTAPDRIAVVAIHGVGYHASGASAESVTDLLEGVREKTDDPNSKHLYGSFIPEEVQIALPPPICGTKPKRAFSFSFDTLEERRGPMKKLSSWTGWLSRKDGPQNRPKVVDIATEYMDTQLEDFNGNPLQNSFTTWRREGTRTSAGDKKRLVDVYDMHWADLSRPSNSFLRFLFSFYQLLLHFVSLGRTALDHAAYENFGKLEWFLYLRLYTYATRVLTLFILQLTVVVFGVALAPVPLLVTGDVAPAILGGSFLAILGLGAVLVLGQKPGVLPGVKSLWFGIPVALVVGALVVWALKGHRIAGGATIFFEWWLLGAGVCFLIALQYDHVRNGSKEVATIFLLATTITLLWLICRIHSLDPVALRTASFQLVQYVFLALRILWILFFVLAFLSFVMEIACRLILRLDASRRSELPRAVAAARTARFALALPSLLILALAIFTGSAVYQYLSKWDALYQGVDPKVMPLGLGDGLALNANWTEQILSLVQKNPPKPTDSCGPAAVCMPNNGVCQASARPQKTALENPNRFLEGIVYQSAPVGMIPGVVIASLGFLILGLLALPSVWYEIFPERSKSKPNKLSIRLGNWLSGGYRHFRWTITLLWTAAFAVPLGFTIYYWIQHHGFHADVPFLFYLYSRPMMVWAADALIGWGGVLAGSGVVLLGLIVKNSSAVLDAILDVDTYLRTSPQEATPRAQIVERYVALLGHLQSREDKANGGRYYKRIIIVAHSLGSNITADMLRFLNKCSEHTDSKHYENYVKFAFGGDHNKALPIYFFSMGCPLRQLLNRFFPHLYQWIREVPEDSGQTFEPTREHDKLTVKDLPLTVDLRIAKWVNFYRSGDYIGRPVWVNDVYARTAHDDGSYPERLNAYDDAPAAGGAATRVEACIGLGAHTHYWDRTAPDVGDQLDRLIAEPI